MAVEWRSFMKSEQWPCDAWNICRCLGRSLFLVIFLSFSFPEPPWLKGTSIAFFPLLLDPSIFILMNVTNRMKSRTKSLENALISCLDVSLMLAMLTSGNTHDDWGWVIAASIAYGTATMVFNTRMIHLIEEWDSYSTTPKPTKNEQAMASQEGDEAKEEEKAGRATTNISENEVQVLESKNNESLKTLFNQEKEPDPDDLAAAELNCLQRDDHHQSYGTKWADDEEEPKDLLAELKWVLELHQEKEREYGELIEKCKQKRIELFGKFVDWLLQRGTSSAEYYRSLYIDCYYTCRKSMEENASRPAENEKLLCSNSTTVTADEHLRENIDRLENKCRCLEEDREQLTASLQAANAAAELYRGYLHDSL